MSAKRKLDTGRKELYQRAPDVLGNRRGLRVRRNARERRQDFREAPGKEFGEHVFQFFRAVGSESVGKAFFPRFEVFRSVRDEFHRVCRSFRNVFKGDAGRKGEYRGSGDSEVRKHGRAVRENASVLVEEPGRGQRKARQLRTPRLERDERGKRRGERSYGMSERFRESVSGAVGTRLRIRGTSGREDYGIEMLNLGFAAIRVPHFETVTLSDYGFDPGSETEIRFGERALENRNDVGSFVGNGKSAEIVLDLNGASGGFKPFPRLFRRKSPEGLFEKIGTSGILGEKIFFRRNSRCDVASSASCYGHLLPHFRVRVENGYAKGRNAFLDQGSANHHAGSAGSYHCDFHFGSVNARDNTRERRYRKIKGPLGPIISNGCVRKDP